MMFWINDTPAGFEAVDLQSKALFIKPLRLINRQWAELHDLWNQGNWRNHETNFISHPLYRNGQLLFFEWVVSLFSASMGHNKDGH